MVFINQEIEIELLDDAINDTNRMIGRDKFFYTGRKKPILLLIVVFEIGIHISDIQRCNIINVSLITSLKS